MINYLKHIDVLVMLQHIVIYVLTLYMLSIIYVILRKKKKTYPNRLAAIFVSNILICSSLFVYVSVQYIFFFSDFFLSGNNYMYYFILLLIGLIIATIVYYIMGRKVMVFRPTTSFIPVSVNKAVFDKSKNKLKVLYKRLQLWLFMFMLGFAILCFTQFLNPRNLVAVFLDNSGSMDHDLQTANGLIAEFGSKLPENTTILFATFKEDLPPNVDLKSSLSDIFKTINSHDLHAADIIEYSPMALKSFFNSSSLRISKLQSPITEVIWALFLRSIEVEKNSIAFPKKHCIILTDGEGLLTNSTMYNNYDLFDKQANPHMLSMNSFYNDIKVINLNKSIDNAFFNSVPGHYHLYADDVYNFNQAFKFATQSLVKRNPIFMYFFIVPIFLFILASLLMPYLVSPK